MGYNSTFPVVWFLFTQSILFKTPRTKPLVSSKLPLSSKFLQNLWLIILITSVSVAIFEDIDLPVNCDPILKTFCNIPASARFGLLFWPMKENPFL